MEFGNPTLPSTDKEPPPFLALIWLYIIKWNFLESDKEGVTYNQIILIAMPFLMLFSR